MVTERIATYRDLNSHKRFAINRRDLAATASGFLLKPQKGVQYVLETAVVTIQGASLAGAIYNAQLVTVDAAGAVSPAAPAFRPLTKCFAVGSNGTGIVSQVFTINGRNIRVPEGYGIGWFCKTTVFGIFTHAIPTFMSLLIAGRCEGTATADAADTNAGFLAPSGLGF